MADSSRKTIDRRRVWLWLYAPLFIWIGVIFYLSSDSGSMSNTSRFLRPFLVFLFPTADESTLLFYHGIVRKLAHFTEYAVLALLAVRAFASTPSIYRWRFVTAITLVALVASLDEYGQSFLVSRTGSIWDVGIDVFGGICAVLALWVLGKWGVGWRRHENPINLDRLPSE